MLSCQCACDGAVVTELAVTRLALSHFRSHKALRLDLDVRPVVLSGPNGAGKTNILEALSLLSPGRGLRRASPAVLARRPEAVGWKISAQLKSPDHVHEIEIRAEPDQPRTQRIDGKVAPQTALGRIARILWLVPAMDRLWTEGAEARRRFLDRMTLSFEPTHGETVLAYEKAMRERNRLMKEGVRDSAWYQVLERQMAKHGARIHRNRLVALDLLARHQARAGSAFPTADLALTGPDSSPDQPIDAEALAATLAEGRIRDMAAGRTLSGPHRADLQALYVAKGIPARECSTGEQKALLISLVLANARALAESFGAPPILLLDEVAAHLDTDRRAALYDEICALGAQAWMTGAEAELFAALGDRAQHMVVRDDAGKSCILPL